MTNNATGVSQESVHIHKSSTKIDRGSSDPKSHMQKEVDVEVDCVWW